MNEIRMILSVITFLLGCYLIFDLFNAGFNFFILSGAILSFILAHYLWPKNMKKGDDEGHWVLDLIEFIVDIPFRSVAYILRSIGRKSGSDLDLDIDL